DVGAGRVGAVAHGDRRVELVMRLVDDDDRQRLVAAARGREHAEFVRVAALGLHARVTEAGAGAVVIQVRAERVGARVALPWSGPHRRQVDTLTPEDAERVSLGERAVDRLESTE